MDDNMLDDLKQFIAATVRQEVTLAVDRLDQKVDRLDQKVDQLDQKVIQLDKKIDDGFSGVGEAIQTVHDTLAHHDTRITTLKSEAA